MLSFTHWLLCKEKFEFKTIFSNWRNYLKNHCTSTRLVCTHFSAFFMLNPNMAMLIWISNFSWKSWEILASFALFVLVARVKETEGQGERKRKNSGKNSPNKTYVFPGYQCPHTMLASQVKDQMTNVTSSPVNRTWFFFLPTFSATNITVNSCVANGGNRGKNQEKVEILRLMLGKMGTEGKTQVLSLLSARAGYVTSRGRFKGDTMACTPLFLQKREHTHLFLQRRHLTVCGRPGTAIFLLKRSLCPPIENSWVHPLTSINNIK